MTEPETVEGRNLVRWLDRALGDQADRDLVRRSVVEIERQARALPADHNRYLPPTPAGTRAQYDTTPLLREVEGS